MYEDGVEGVWGKLMMLEVVFIGHGPRDGRRSCSSQVEISAHDGDSVERPEMKLGLCMYGSQWHGHCIRDRRADGRVKGAVPVTGRDEDIVRSVCRDYER